MDQRVNDADSELTYIKDSLATMDLRLQTKEDLLRKQFTAMEQAIAASQSASSSLAGQLAGLSNG
jgi:flagellar hook-associated protein 2